MWKDGGKHQRHSRWNGAHGDWALRWLGIGEGYALVRNDALGLEKDTPWFGTMPWGWGRIRPGSERCLGAGEDTPWFGTMPWGWVGSCPGSEQGPGVVQRKRRGVAADWEGYALVRNDASGLGGGRAHRWGPLLTDGAQSRPHPLVASFFWGRRGLLLVEPGCVFEGKGTNEVSPRNLAAGRSIPVFRELGHRTERGVFIRHGPDSHVFFAMRGSPFILSSSFLLLF